MTASARTASVVAARPRRLVRRHLWGLPGLAIAFYAGPQAELHGLGLAPLLIFGIAPHLPALLGSRGVALFNAMHHPLLPLALLLAATGLLAPVWFVGALAWLSHIVVDWALAMVFAARMGPVEEDSRESRHSRVLRPRPPDGGRGHGLDGCTSPRSPWRSRGRVCMHRDPIARLLADNVGRRRDTRPRSSYAERQSLHPI